MGMGGKLQTIFARNARNGPDQQRKVIFATPQPMGVWGQVANFFLRIE